MLKNKLFYGFGLLLMLAKPSFSQQWSKEQANDWYAKQSWVLGCNFIPSTAINQLEMWQVETFDTTTIDRELAYMEGIGMNTARVFLHYLVWQQDWPGFRGRMRRQRRDRHRGFAFDWSLGNLEHAYYQRRRIASRQSYPTYGNHCG